MDIEIRLRRRVLNGEDIRELNDRVLSCMSGVDNLWIKGKSPADAYFDPGTGESASVDVSPCLTNGVEGAISYASRLSGAIADKARSDDVLTLRVDADSIDYAWFSGVVFRSLIDCFRPYRGAVVTDIDLDLDDFEEVCREAQSTGLDVDGRDTIFRINSANYFDDQMCKRAFGYEAKNLVEKLAGSVELVEHYRDGILILTSRYPVIGEESLAIDGMIKARIAT